MQISILGVDQSGFPVRWLSYESAARHYTIGNVLWTIGDSFYVLHGGISRISNAQSTLSLHPIIAIRGLDLASRKKGVPLLTNKRLFARDQHLCLYCGGEFTTSLLTRDHVQPSSRGGADEWTNVVSACKACNNKKGNRTPDEAGMQLLALPFSPNHAESLILSNRHILADQQEFLKSFSKKMAV